MELMTDEALEEFVKEISSRIDTQVSTREVAGISSEDLCKNKDLILNFLGHLTGLLPGVIGKVMGSLITKAAEAWFEKKC